MILSHSTVSFWRSMLKFRKYVKFLFMEVSFWIKFIYLFQASWRAVWTQNELVNDQWCNWTAAYRKFSLGDEFERPYLWHNLFMKARLSFWISLFVSYFYVIVQWSKIIAFIYPHSNPLSQSGNTPFLFNFEIGLKRQFPFWIS